ncbi:MAG: nucleotidyltransferase family protein [Lachnospiraceae bacterium]
MILYYVLLAAGSSRRFGENKLLYSFHGKAMYRYGLDCLLSCRQSISLGECDIKILVVTQYEQIQRELEAEQLPVTICWNEHPEWGISYSMQLALEYSAKDKGEESAFALFFVADQPYLSAEEMAGFTRAFLDSHRTLGCVCCHGETGNPVVFGENFWEELMEIRGDRGGKGVLKKHIEEAFLYEVGAAVLVDFDKKPETISLPSQTLPST